MNPGSNGPGGLSWSADSPTPEMKLPADFAIEIRFGNANRPDARVTLGGVTDKPAPVVGEGVFRATTMPDEAERRRLHSLAEIRNLEVFASVELERVEGSNGLLVFTGSGDDHGTLWVQGSKHDVEFRGREKVRVVYEGDPLTPRFLIPASEQGLPATLAEWEARQNRRGAAVEQQRQEAAANLDRLRLSAEAVTYDDLGRDRVRMTLRKAGEAVERAGGVIQLKGSRLLVSLPPGALLTMGAPSAAAKAAARLYLAEAAILAAAGKRSDIAASKLPNKHVLPSGKLEP